MTCADTKEAQACVRREEVEQSTQRLQMFADGLDAALHPAMTEAIDRWVDALVAQAAMPHSTVVLRFCRYLDWTPRKSASLSLVIDLLQLAIDVADHLYDDQLVSADDDEGVRAYSPSLLPSLTCLPALLVGHATARLASDFENGAYAAARTLEVLATMAAGQSLTGREKVEAVSGEQGLLLCLPLWISSNTFDDDKRQRVETWARAFGRTWELMQQALEEDSPRLRARYRFGMRHLMAAWPREEPFLWGQPLGPDAFGPQTIQL